MQYVVFRYWHSSTVENVEAISAEDALSKVQPFSPSIRTQILANVDEVERTARNVDNHTDVIGRTY